jgi:hypothetical protein
MSSFGTRSASITPVITPVIDNAAARQQNRDVREAVSLVLLILLGVAPAVAFVDCAGWQDSAADRMACCVRTHDDCVTQAAADDCCSATEQSRPQGSGA